MTHVIHVSAAVIVDAADRVLLVRKAGTDAFMQPGGKPEPGEDAATALVRELAEEIGVTVSVAQLRPLGRFTAAAANEPGHSVVAEVFAIDDTGLVPVRGAEIEELLWLTPAEASALPLAPLTREHLLPLVWG